MTDWLGKPYYSLDAYLKKTFGEKVYNLSPFQTRSPGRVKRVA